MAQTIPIPQIFLLWHPRCRLGEALARRILQWLSPGNGLGPEVFYRSLPAPGAPANGLPLPLPGETRAGPARAEESVSKLPVVLPLIDENMVTDLAWRRWLDDLTNPSKWEMMPVALDATAYNMPARLRELNYLRPAGLPLPPGEGMDGSAFEGVARSLLKQVTEALCRLMLPRPAPAEDPGAVGSRGPLPKVSVFLSHAKQDGTGPARRLRDYIYSQTQLAAFYDENDIAFSSVFSKVIHGGLESPDTAALIVVRSVLYPTRPWCRQELFSFRTPRPAIGRADGLRTWRLFPVLVVEAMEGREPSAGIPELGNSPVIRWNDDDSGMEELIVTTVIRDAMFASFHAAIAALIPKQENQIVINWLPDPATLLLIPSLQSGQKFQVVYPGRRLSGLELDFLASRFPKLTFRSFEEVLT